MQTKTRKERYIYFVRHGQRRDHVSLDHPEYLNDTPDSPLTILGLKQAAEVGTFLAKTLPADAK